MCGSPASSATRLGISYNSCNNSYFNVCMKIGVVSCSGNLVALRLFRCDHQVSASAFQINDGIDHRSLAERRSCDFSWHFKVIRTWRMGRTRVRKWYVTFHDSQRSEKARFILTKKSTLHVLLRSFVCLYVGIVCLRLHRIAIKYSREHMYIHTDRRTDRPTDRPSEGQKLYKRLNFTFSSQAAALRRV